MLFENQVMREALVKLMLLARYADSKLTVVEKNTFERILDQLDWQGVKSEYSFRDTMLAEVRQAFVSDEATEGFIFEQCELFKTPENKRLCLKKIESVFMADGLSPEESGMLQKIRTQLEL